MSMVGQALLVVLEHVLENRTWADDRIAQQPIDPIDDLLREGRKGGKPVLAIYAEQSESDPVGLETQRGTQELTLKVVGYVSPTVTRVSENHVEVRMDAKGAGLALNILARQVDMALHHGNADWVRLFRKFAVAVRARKTRFVLIEIESGVRIPCIEIEYKMDVVPEPEIATPLYGAWADLDGLLRDEGGDGIDLADMLKRLVEGPSDMQTWEQFQAATGLTDAGYMATGLAPIVVTDTGPPDIEDVVSEPDVEVVAPIGGG